MNDSAANICMKRTRGGLFIPDTTASNQLAARHVRHYKVKNPPLVGRALTCCVCGLSGGSLVKVDSECYRHTFCSGRKRGK